MKSIKRTRSVSHKKKKVTAAQFKLEQIRTRKQTAMKKWKTNNVTNDGAIIDETITNDIIKDISKIMK